MNYLGRKAAEYPVFSRVVRAPGRPERWLERVREPALR